MDNLIVAAAQFEHRCGDKQYNLDVIRRLSAEAAALNARMVSFHECSISGYAHARRLSRDELLSEAEFVPDGPGVQALIAIARNCGLAVMAGLYERDEEGLLYNTYVCVDNNGLIARHRKLHPFIHADLVPGNAYTLFDLHGWKLGILTCYDNNVVENVRATSLLGAQILVMPHVTMMTPAPRPGAGYADPSLWLKRIEDPASLRFEFDGPKGRGWLMKWLPSRACDNGIYAVFANAIGMDDDQLKNGCSMIIDPHGDILAECRRLGDQVVAATIVPEKLTKSGGFRYTLARRTELFGAILSRPHSPVQNVAWIGNSESV